MGFTAAGAADLLTFWKIRGAVIYARKMLQMTVRTDFWFVESSLRIENFYCYGETTWSDFILVSIRPLGQICWDRAKVKCE